MYVRTLKHLEKSLRRNVQKSHLRFQRFLQELPVMRCEVCYCHGNRLATPEATLATPEAPKYWPSPPEVRWVPRLWKQRLRRVHVPLSWFPC